MRRKIVVLLIWIVPLLEQPVTSSDPKTNAKTLDLNDEPPATSTDVLSMTSEERNHQSIEGVGTYNENVPSETYYSKLQHILNTKEQNADGFSEALEEFKGIIERNIEHLNCQENVPNAVNDFKRTLEMNPHQSILFYKHFCEILLEAGKCDEARIILDKLNEKVLSERHKITLDKISKKVRRAEKERSLEGSTSIEAIDHVFLSSLEPSLIPSTRLSPTSNNASSGSNESEYSKIKELLELGDDQVEKEKALEDLVIIDTSDPKDSPTRPRLNKLPIRSKTKGNKSSSSALPWPRRPPKVKPIKADKKVVRKIRPRTTPRKKKVKLNEDPTELLHLADVVVNFETGEMLQEGGQRRTENTPPASLRGVVDTRDQNEGNKRGWEEHSQKSSSSALPNVQANVQSDDFDWTVKTWVKELKMVSSAVERICAKKAIYDVLFQAQLGLLHRNSASPLINKTLAGVNIVSSAAGGPIEIGTQQRDLELTERTWICELRSVADPRQVLLAKKLVNDVLFEAQMETLQRVAEIH